MLSCHQWLELGMLGLVAACSGSVQGTQPNAVGGGNTGAGTSGGAASMGGSLAGGAASSGGSKVSSSVVVATGGIQSVGGASNTGGSKATNSGGSSAQGGAVAVDGIVPLTQATSAALTDSACVGFIADAQPAPFLLDFVVDSSGSMSGVAPNTSNGMSKWSVTQNSLRKSIAAMPVELSVGLLLWPNMVTVPNRNDLTGTVLPVESCVNVSARVPVGTLGVVGSAHRGTLDATIVAAVPAGATPMADAYNYALQSGMISSALPGSRAMVLVTDGQPTIQLGCMGTGEEAKPVDFTPVLSSIAAANNSFGIKTYLVGSPGSEHQSLTGADGRALLSAAARAGGTAPTSCSDSGPRYCHYDLTTIADFEAGFAAAINAIVAENQSCEFAMPNLPAGAAVDPSALNVIYRINGSSLLSDSRLVLPAPNASCPQGNGWYLDSVNSNRISLCPNTCTRIRSDIGAVLQVVGGCAPLSAG